MEYYIGIDLGGTNIAAALVDGQGKILGRANLATGAGRPAAEIAADMAHAGRRAAEQAGVPIEQVSAVGMGVPGTANQKEGVLEFANNLGFLHEPIVEMMAGCFPGKQIWFDNDANAAAWGEYLAGGGRGADSMIAVTLGTGVGGGIILGGKLWNGVNYGAGELGHMVIDQNGPECNCGRRGCFEALASATALIRQTREAMDNAPKSLMWELCGGDKRMADGRTVFEAAGRGDRTAAMVVERYIGYLAVGITNLVNLFQPEIICIGGGVSLAGAALLEPLKQIVAAGDYARDSSVRTEIRLAELGNDAGLIGAALLGRR
ncbi:ROK family protein [Enterocloster lavalensis]|uniref:ROK family protein n=1 Tax=Enterocloster lavalensis TaxID=460384 RepID=UPI0023F28547|nr:ROK family protein [Enterocloster lavalensis]